MSIKIIQHQSNNNNIIIMKILIVGAGVAGLTLGAILQKKGIDYHIYDKRQELLGEDYALTISQASNVIRYLGIKFDQKLNLACFASLNEKLEFIDYTYHSKGNYAILRHDLIKELLALIPEGKITLNTEMDYQKCLDSQYDYFVIADGISSPIRKSLIGKDICCRTGLKILLMKIEGNHPLIKADTVYQILGEFKNGSRDRIFIKPFAKNQSMCQIVGSNPIIPDFIIKMLANGSQFYRNDLLYLDLNDDSFINILTKEEKFILLGDALHGMTPYAGQGANLAMENALILANNLEKKLPSQFYYEQIWDKAKSISMDSFNRVNLIHFQSKLRLSGDDLCIFSDRTVITPYVPTVYDSPCSYVISQDKITNMNLSGLKLSMIPEQIYDLIHLKSLDLKDNLISQIPKNISNLKQLKNLFIRNNLITDVPNELWDMFELRILRLSYNRIVHVSNKISNLQNLNELCLSGNQIKILPRLNLPKLKKLYIAKNNIKRYPYLKQLPSLTVLRLQWNPLRSFYLRTLNYSNLEIHVSENILSNLPISSNVFPSSKLVIYYGEKETTISAITSTYNSTTNIALKDILRDLLKQNQRCLVDMNLQHYLTFLPDVKDTSFSEIALKIAIYKSQELSNEEREVVQTYLSKFVPHQIVNILLSTNDCPISEENNRIIEKNSSWIRNHNLLISKDYQINLDNHEGLPRPDSIEGRPRLNMNQCLHKDCSFTDIYPYSLMNHLINNNAYRQGYHVNHLKYINSAHLCMGDTECPVSNCAYRGDLKLHFKLLGISPFWQRGMKLEELELTGRDLSLEIPKIYTTSECVICYDQKADVLYSECLHNVVCGKCLSNTTSTNYFTCPICRNKNTFVLPCNMQ